MTPGHRLCQQGLMRARDNLINLKDMRESLLDLNADWITIDIRELVSEIDPQREIDKLEIILSKL